MRSSNSRSNVPKRITGTGGVHLRGTPLWIDAAKRKELCIVTGLLTRMPPAHTRLVTSAPLAEVLKRAGHKSTVLSSPPDRWLGVAGQKVQLVTSGVTPLASAAYVALADENVLVTGPLRAGANDWPRTDHIVAHVPALKHQGTDLDDVADRIAARAERERYSVRVECLEVADALAKALADRGVICTGRGLVRHLGLTGVGDIVLSLTTVKPATERCIDVATGLGTTSTRGAIPLRWFANAETLAELVASAKPKRVTLIGQRDATIDLPTELAWETEPRQLVFAK